MTYQVTLNNFNGPLELLLQLVERSRVTIREVPLADITEQYLNYVQKLGSIPPAEMGDFIVLATRLAHLKSRDLIAEDDNQGEAMVELEEELETYRQYREAARLVGTLWDRPKRGFTRMPKPRELTYERPNNLTPHQIAQAIARTRERQHQYIHKAPTPSVPFTKIIAELVGELRQLPRSDSHRHTLNDILKRQPTRQKSAMVFLAALELWRDGSVELAQAAEFETISIRYV